MCRLPPGRDRSYGAATMNDAGQGENASGAWQPDPTGRYRLRWQRDTGEWTDHVYSSEGELGNDPYDAPPAPMPPPPGSGVPDLGDSPHSADAQKPPKRRGRKLLIALGIIIGFFIALGITGILVETGPDATPGSPSRSTDTSGTPAPTAAPTTPPAGTESDCRRQIGRATTLTTSWLGEAETVLTGDFNSATLAFDVAFLTYDNMQAANLDAYACALEAEWYDEAERWADAAEAAQNLKAELHYTCSTELEPRGFVCPS